MQVCVCVCMHAHVCNVPVYMCVIFLVCCVDPVNELRSPGLAVGAFTHWATLPSLLPPHFSLSVWSRLPLNSQFPCLNLLSAWVIGRFLLSSHETCRETILSCASNLIGLGKLREHSYGIPGILPTLFQSSLPASQRPHREGLCSSFNGQGH